MKFGQLIEYNKINIFYQNHTENSGERLGPDRFLFFKKRRKMRWKNYSQTFF